MIYKRFCISGKLINSASIKIEIQDFDLIIVYENKLMNKNVNIQIFYSTKLLFSEFETLHKCVVKYWENGDKNESKLKSGV